MSKKSFLLISAIGILIAAFSIAYYFVIFLPKGKAGQNAQLYPVQINWDQKWRDFLARKQSEKDFANSQCNQEIRLDWDQEKLQDFERNASKRGYSERDIDDFLNIRYKKLQRELTNCLRRKGLS